MRIQMIRKITFYLMTITLLSLLTGCATNTEAPAASVAPAATNAPAATTAPATSSGKATTTTGKPVATKTATPTPSPIAKIFSRTYQIPAGTVIAVRLNDTL